MTQIAIVIVNYNVKHFIENCLHSVRLSMQGIDAKVVVVDNNSVDGSCAMIREKFPEVQLIENKENVGFSMANNQAIRSIKSKYYLLLNPDTLIQEDTLSKCLAFMNGHSEAGALGVKMVDGKARFLPESKRSLPTPWVAFYKIFGISSLFPHSKKFGRYHLSYLKTDEIHSVDVLSGAFMFLREEALQKTGLLDETFFMYGEDIDLSYRLLKAGYKNYYFPKTTIIHYKGESTRKGSLNYVLVFYNAMIIFAKKHFSKNNAGAFTFIIKIAIYLRALLSMIKQLSKKTLLPLLDFTTILAGYTFIKHYWEQYKFHGSASLPRDLFLIAIPCYILVWLTAIFFSGGYDKPIRMFKSYRGIIAGTIIILVVYALLPEQMRFSRALILFGSGLAIIAISLNRLLFHFISANYRLDLNKTKRIVLVGNIYEAQRVQEVIKLSGLKSEIVGFVSPDSSITNNIFIGNIDNLFEAVQINKIDEVIFCAKEITSQHIIERMLELAALNIDFKIAPPDSMSVIGSNSIHTAGELYTVYINSIATKANRRKKRMLDLISTSFILALSPILILFQKNPLKLFRNCIHILIGLKSWVGYTSIDPTKHSSLPLIKVGILSPANHIKDLSPESASRLNFIYARDYLIYSDMYIIFRNLNHLSD